MDVSVRIAGSAGQGMQTTAELLGRICTRAGLFAHCRIDAESRIRGGLNFAQLRIGSAPVAGVSEKIDILVAHTQRAVDEFSPSLSPNSILLAQKPVDHQCAVPFVLEEAAREAGSEKAAGTVALGALCSFLGVKPYFFEAAIQEAFERDSGLAAINQKAAALGKGLASSIKDADRFLVRSQTSSQVKNLWISGAEAVALGAIAGGVSFFAGYPMSPATGIMAALAKWAAEAEVHVEQAEDEIAAINMVSGASFAGARSMTATSGGGYCLMTEGASLLGMIEAPAVIALSQRPGPATGLPTRMAQGDLNLARFGGHGFFPKIILAPKNIPDAFEVAASAFDLAEKFQVPVYLLTDQLINDGRATCAAPETGHLPSMRYFLPNEDDAAQADYKRYAWSDDGVSPIAMPGKSKRLVYADSDEHDEWGHITESGAVAEQMVEKRMAKAATVSRSAWTSDISGNPDSAPLVVSWGSTFETVREALTDLAGQTAQPGQPAHLHLRWLWPLGSDVVNAVNRASRVIVVENSPTAGLPSILKETACRKVDAVVDKLDGRPFSVEELRRRISEEIKG